MVQYDYSFVVDKNWQTVTITDGRIGEIIEGRPWEFQFQSDEGKSVRVKLASESLNELCAEMKETDLGPDTLHSGNTAVCSLW